TLRIKTDSSFIAYGYKGFLTYGLNGKFQSRVRLKDFQVPNFLKISMGFGMEKFGDKYLHFDQGSRHVDYSNIEVYREMRLLNWLDPKTGEKEPFIHFPANSIFSSGKFFFRDSWAPVFTLADGLIYLAFGIEPVVYVYETYPPYALVSSFPLDLPDYRYFKGEESYTPGLEMRGFHYGSGRILNIKKVDGHFLVSYFPGYTPLDREESFVTKSPEEARLFRERMGEKYAPRIAVLDSLGNRLSDFVPEGLVASSMLVRNGELWMLEKPDEEIERDYFRLFRVGLKYD